MASLDRRAIYEPRTETIRTGEGDHVRIRDLHMALSSLSGYQIRRLAQRAGIHKGINDPFEADDQEAVKDILDLCRAMPQYCRPVVDAGISLGGAGKPFQALLRNRMFGDGGEGHYSSATDPTSDPKLFRFFYDTKDQAGEYSYFIRQDRTVPMLRNGQRFDSDEPYQSSFVVIRTLLGRFYLRWPEHHRDEPAFYLQSDGTAHFFPSEGLEFEELYPGYTYEVFGVQFSLPDVGVDYRFWQDDAFDEDEPETSETPLPVDRKAELLELLEAWDVSISSLDELSKHFRKLSLKYHPLKHLHASEEEKIEINEHYLTITNAYNELKKYYR